MIRRSTTTVEEFETLSGRIGPCELLQGEVVQLSPGGFRHNDITSNIHGLLWQWAKRGKTGRALTNETGIVVESDPDTVRGADVLFISFTRLPRGETFSGFLTTPPELVAEVIGKGQGWADMVE
jgi:Uma2 family endonuclease